MSTTINTAPNTHLRMSLALPPRDSAIREHIDLQFLATLDTAEKRKALPTLTQAHTRALIAMAEHPMISSIHTVCRWPETEGIILLRSDLHVGLTKCVERDRKAAGGRTREGGKYVRRHGK